MLCNPGYDITGGRKCGEWRKSAGELEVSREDALRQRQEHPPGQIRDWSTRLEHDADGIVRVRRAREAAWERRDEGNGGVDRADDRQSQQKREEKFFHCFKPKVNLAVQTSAYSGKRRLLRFGWTFSEIRTGRARRHVPDGNLI